MRLTRFVYFLRPVGMEGPVKIGCSCAVESRFAIFVALAPWPLEIAATTPGDTDLESRFHARFIEQHYHHEWFHASRALTATIDAVKAGTFDASSLPPHGRRPHLKREFRWSDDQRRAAGYAQRLARLRGRGVKIPGAVWSAKARFSGHVSANDPSTRYQPEDAAIIEAFLADHPRLTNMRRAA